MADSYWFDIGGQRVVRGPERGDGWIGPFDTAEEAEESPEKLQQIAREWLDSEEGQRFYAMGKELFGELENE